MCACVRACVCVCVCVCNFDYQIQFIITKYNSTLSIKTLGESPLLMNNYHIRLVEVVVVVVVVAAAAVVVIGMAR